MIQETRNDQKYIPSQRYIVMIEDLETGQVYYSKRIGTLAKAINVAAEYNALASIAAKIIDTKNGDIL